VLFRDDWSADFDVLQNDLQAMRTEREMEKRGVVALVANRTLANTEAEQELIRISGSNTLPAVAIYPKDAKSPPLLLTRPISESSLIEALMADLQSRATQ
jgi:hypothetical protein